MEMAVTNGHVTSFGGAQRQQQLQHDYEDDDDDDEDGRPLTARPSLLGACHRAPLQSCPIDHRQTVRRRAVNDADHGITAAAEVTSLSCQQTVHHDDNGDITSVSRPQVDGVMFSPVFVCLCT